MADELERSAGRAKERGGVAAAAAFLERSAHFTPDPMCQALRCLRAADTYLEAGAHEEARNLLKSASRRLDDPLARAQAMRLDAAIRFAEGRGGETPTLFLHAARALREVDPASAVDTLTEALEAATWAGELGSGTTARELAVAAAQLPDGDHERSATLLLQGYAARSNDYREAVRLWSSAVLAGARDATGATRLQQLSVLFLVTGDMLDFEHHAAVADERVRVARAEGALMYLPGALSGQAWCARLAGHLDRAHALDVESTEIADAIGAPPTPGAHDIVRLGLVAWQGQDAEARKLAETVASEAIERGQGMTVAMVESFLMTLDLGTGRYEEALGHGRTLLDADPLYVCSLSLGDVVEAAVRADDRGTSAAALTRLQERAGASGTPWGLGLLARARALLADDSRAESLYLESLEHLRRAGVATDWARSSLVFGEWLRRQRRRRDARVQLRSAERFFEATGAEAFLQRAATELRATGEQGRSHRFSERIQLTPQEQRVAELAAEGLTNAEIGAQLFVSPHTVSYHLRKVFTKLDVRSRKPAGPRAQVAARGQWVTWADPRRPINPRDPEPRRAGGDDRGGALHSGPSGCCWRCRTHPGSSAELAIARCACRIRLSAFDPDGAQRAHRQRSAPVHSRPSTLASANRCCSGHRLPGVLRPAVLFVGAPSLRSMTRAFGLA